MICDIFDFWAERGCSFRVLPLFDGPPSRNGERYDAGEADLVDALCRLFAHWMQSSKSIAVAPLDEWLANVVRHLLGVRVHPYDRRHRGESVLVVRPDGRVFQVAELGDDALCIGDLNRQSIADLLSSHAYLASLDRSEAVTRERCTGCRFRGGCDSWPAHTAAVEHRESERCHVAYRVHEYIERYLDRIGLNDAVLAQVAAVVPAAWARIAANA